MKKPPCTKKYLAGVLCQGRLDEAAAALHWLRGAGYDVAPELEALAGKGAKGGSSSMGDTLRAFRYPGAYKPFAVLIFVFIFQQLSGSYAIIFYAVTLFKVTSSVLHETYNKLQGHRSVNEPIRSCDRHRGHQADRNPAR